jgi:hypothetical protein
MSALGQKQTSAGVLVTSALPPKSGHGSARLYRYGPTGSTNRETLAKQIGRQKDEMDRDPRRRKYIELFASQLAQWVPHIS